jgi:hypothetical protein
MFTISRKETIVKENRLIKIDKKNKKVMEKISCRVLKAYFMNVFQVFALYLLNPSCGRIKRRIPAFLCEVEQIL